MKKIRIGLVSYLNTLPFVHAINMMKKEQTKWDIETIETYPSNCTRLFQQNKIDIGIIPVGGLPQLNNEYKIVSDFCLGANQSVDSVLLLSYHPLKEIDTILLDYQSNTSVLLTKILSKYFWHITPKWQEAVQGFENNIRDKTAGVVIGDRTFSLKNNFPHVYDLALEWYQFQKLPFVFALWVANLKLPEPFIKDFNLFLEKGIKEIPEAFDLFKNNYHLTINRDTALNYLTKKMAYHYSSAMQNSKDKFLSFLNDI